MSSIRVLFNDGRSMIAEPGLTFDGYDRRTGAGVKYVCFTDHRTTGPILAKRHYLYYFKFDYNSRCIIFSDNDTEEEFDFVRKTIAKSLDCAPKGLLCLFELVRGGIKNIEYV